MHIYAYENTQFLRALFLKYKFNILSALQNDLKMWSEKTEHFLYFKSRYVQYVFVMDPKYQKSNFLTYV